MSKSAKSAKSVGKNKTRELLFDVDALAIAASILEKRNNKSTKFYGLSECVHINDRHSKRGKNALARFVVRGRERKI